MFGCCMTKSTTRLSKYHVACSYFSIVNIKEGHSVILCRCTSCERESTPFFKTYYLNTNNQCYYSPREMARLSLNNITAVEPIWYIEVIKSTRYIHDFPKRYLGFQHVFLFVSWLPQLLQIQFDTGFPIYREFLLVFISIRFEKKVLTWHILEIINCLMKHWSVILSIPISFLKRKLLAVRQRSI